MKCLVWDLDDTLWHGTLLEGDELVLRDGAAEVLATLDARGILLSIASRNDPDQAMAALARFGLSHYFLAPRIGWGAKPDSLRAIAADLAIDLGSLGFVDDQATERAEVAFSLPQVLCLDPADLGQLLMLPALSPRFVTDDSRRRRQRYREAAIRNAEERAFSGSREEFLASLEMELSLAPAREGDLERAEELTQRTHQFNSTGHAYGYEELSRLRTSPDHLLLVAGLTDRFGSYGTIGLMLIERRPARWTLTLLLVSCRVLSKGIASLLLRQVRAMARANGATLVAELVPNPRNVLMAVTYKFAGFREVARSDGLVTYQDGLEALEPWPAHVRLRWANHVPRTTEVGDHERPNQPAGDGAGARRRGRVPPGAGPDRPSRGPEPTAEAVRAGPQPGDRDRRPSRRRGAPAPRARPAGG